MDSVVAFAAGVIVGAVLIVGLQAIRRSGPVPSPTDPQPASHPESLLGSVLSGRRVWAGGRVGLHADVTVSGSRSVIRMDHGAPTVEIDGVTYHRLADVPADARALLLEELRLIKETPNLPDGSLNGLDAFMAGDDAAEPAGS